MLFSCKPQQSKTLSESLILSSSKPDSALAILNKINREELSEADAAKYSLIYTKSQDKSGMDVDDDSLIRIAYNWYYHHQDDTLYQVCLYYMGKYYSLNDSLGQAKTLFEKAYQIAKKRKNKEIMGLSLEQLAKAEEIINPQLSLKHAKMEVELCEKDQEATLYDKIYSRLRLCESYAMCDSFAKALYEGNMALKYANTQNKDNVISDCYQDLACVYQKLNLKDSCLVYAKKAYLLGNKNNASQIMLASSYVDCDSIQEAMNILNCINPKSSLESYTIYYTKTCASLKEGNGNRAQMYLDSTCFHLEDLYQKTLEAKTNYYVSSLNKEKENSQLRVEKNRLFYTYILFIIVLIFTITFIIHAYLAYKKQAKMKWERQRELYEKEKMMAEKLHQEELAHKAVQLNMMRNYLVRKIDIIEKLNHIKSEGKHIVLSEDDWKEIEIFLESVEDLFVTKLKQMHPNLSYKDIRLMMLLRIKLPQKTLASIYGISEKAIKQKLFLYKEKVGIKNEPISLREYIETI